MKKLSHQIIALSGPDHLVKRLVELGFVESEILMIQSKLPFGGPYVVALKNAQFALREEELQCLQLKPMA